MKLIIKQALYHGQDSKTFRAYSPALAPNQRDQPLGVNASTTGNRLVGVVRCAAKAFQKFEEPKTSLIELENRARVSVVNDATGIFEVTLDPK